ncbi:NYN domain-containing protein [Candidatus Palauibacter sp.]|uniref:NYN domain-containing protein n=1 Tax=Candidatus Palauibacter sp. TaxID=3101350 RepID=UPI003B0234D7
MRGTEEKGVDVRMATDMISLAWVDNYDIAVLVSSDRDFVQPGAGGASTSHVCARSSASPNRRRRHLSAEQESARWSRRRWVEAYDRREEDFRCGTSIPAC